MDNNRGRDGEAYQAEHFVVLHDEEKGWIDIVGNGRYENTKKELALISDSPFFQFQSTPETGLTITSVKNQLTLKIAPHLTADTPYRREVYRVDGFGTGCSSLARTNHLWPPRYLPHRFVDLQRTQKKGLEQGTAFFHTGSSRGVVTISFEHPEMVHETVHRHISPI